MDTSSKESLVQGFSRYFSVKLAESEAQKKAVFHIRYRVYCEEFKYESVDHFPDQLEIDDYDEVSKHCLITHLETGAPAGCVRLIPALGSREDEPLPFEKYCKSSLDCAFIDSMSLDRGKVCEISRLAVDGTFRRRTGESITRFGQINGLHFSPEEQRTFSLIAVACFLATTVMSEMENRTNGFAMMEPFLPRMMHKSGIDFHRVGKDIDYHGIRAPYFVTTQSILANMHTDLRQLYQWIKENIAN